MLASNRELADKLDELEHRIATHDKQIQAIFEEIRQLISPPNTPRRLIGFQSKGNQSGAMKQKGRRARLQRAGLSDWREEKHV